MFDNLKTINEKPEAFGFYTAEELWTDEYTSGQMLSYHLNGEIDVASRSRQKINDSVEWIVEHFSLDSNSSVCDFGCGPGLYASGIAAKGPRVTGVDFSRRSLDYAIGFSDKHGLNINYIHQNYLEFDRPERFDLITMIMCDFCVLSPTQRARLLGVFETHLADGGHVMLDVNSMAAFSKREEVALYEKNLLNGFWSDAEYFGFLNTFKYEAEKVVLDKYTIIKPSEQFVIYNWFQHFSPEDLAKEFKQAGLEVKAAKGDFYGSDYSDSSDEFAVIAVKS